MAGMLPPFVPPSARVSTQPLPLITEFVLDRGEQPVEQSFTVEQWEPPAPASFETEATLPSIDEFLLESPIENDIAPAGTPPQMEDSTEAPFLAQSPVPTEEMPEPAAPEMVAAETVETALATDEHATDEQASDEQATDEQASDEQASDEQASHEQASDEQASDEQAADAQAADEQVTADESAFGQSAPVESEAEAVPQIGPEDVARAAPEPATEAGSESWVGDERDSFNWQRAANLAAPADNERRASDDWSSTNWERPSSSSQDHVVALLGQIARRVRSGELHVHASHNMSAEAVLAAVLVALLAEPGGH
ncbi:MAG: hypothetical protein ACR2M1_14025 [Gemmatimonadaceae bacterium]